MIILGLVGLLACGQNGPANLDAVVLEPCTSSTGEPCLHLELPLKNRMGQQQHYHVEFSVPGTHFAPRSTWLELAPGEQTLLERDLLFFRSELQEEDGGPTCRRQHTGCFDLQGRQAGFEIVVESHNGPLPQASGTKAEPPRIFMEDGQRRCSATEIQNERMQLLTCNDRRGIPPASALLLLQWLEPTVSEKTILTSAHRRIVSLLENDQLADSNWGSDYLQRTTIAEQPLKRTPSFERPTIIYPGQVKVTSKFVKAERDMYGYASHLRCEEYTLAAWGGVIAPMTHSGTDGESKARVDAMLAFLLGDPAQQREGLLDRMTCP